jgi:hypothetical protein
MDIKLINEEVTYKEIATKKTYSINGKEVKVNTWIKQDNAFSDYEDEKDVNENDMEKLTSEEQNAFEDWLGDEE